MDKIMLNNGTEMPLLGFGVFQITDEKICEESVSAALNTGYRMIDTAACYGNERAVGNAIQKSGIPREEIFISSKVWIQDAGYEATKKSFEKTLKNLQTDYLDLILSHDIVPAINQIELHPFSQQKELRSVMEKYDIQPMAWAPFAEGQNNIFNNKILAGIGENYGKTPAQVILRWLRQSNITAIPKSVHEERIRQNYDVDDFELSEEDMKKVEQMDTGKSLILDVPNLNEVYRLHDIRFEQ